MKNLNVVKITIFSIAILSLPCLHAKDKTKKHPVSHVASTDGLVVVFEEGRIGPVSIEYKGKECLKSPAYLQTFGTLWGDDGKMNRVTRSRKRLRHKYSCLFQEIEDAFYYTATEKAREEWPLNTKIGWIIKKGEPGLYYYVSYQHQKGYPVVSLEQNRMSLCISDAFAEPPTKVFVDYQNNCIFDVISLKQRLKWYKQGKIKSIMDATALYPDGSICTKYQWQAYKENESFYGFANNKLGLWQLIPSVEAVNNGPLRQKVFLGTG